MVGSSSEPVSLPAPFGLGLCILASFATHECYKLQYWLLLYFQHSWGSQEVRAACWRCGVSTGGWQRFPLQDKPGRSTCLALSGLILMIASTVWLKWSQNSTPPACKACCRETLLNQCQVRGPAIVGSNPLPCKCRRGKHKTSFSFSCFFFFFSQQTAFELQKVISESWIEPA